MEDFYGWLAESAEEQRRMEAERIIRLLKDAFDPGEEERKRKAKEDYYRVERERASEQRLKDEEEHHRSRKEIDARNAYGRQSKIGSPEYIQWIKDLQDSGDIESPRDKFRSEVDEIVCRETNRPSHTTAQTPSWSINVPCGIHVFFNVGEDYDSPDIEKMSWFLNLIDHMFEQGYEAQETADRVLIELKKLGRA